MYLSVGTAQKMSENPQVLNSDNDESEYWYAVVFPDLKRVKINYNSRTFTRFDVVKI